MYQNITIKFFLKIIMWHFILRVVSPAFLHVFDRFINKVLLQYQSYHVFELIFNSGHFINGAINGDKTLVSQKSR